MAISPSAHTTSTRPEQNRGYGEAAHHLAAALALAGMALVALVAGTGWLYLLRKWGLFSFGPRVSGSLELEKLASADAQPLARLVVAWVPAGLVLGRTLGTRTRAVVAGLAVFALLILLGAVSDAVENSQSVGGWLGDQFGRGGPWVASALVVMGTYLGVRAREARQGPGARASISG